jgi:UDPglucose 6-dehydrogenase
MRVCVAGLWHLGSVTCACLAAGGHDVVGLDDDRAKVAALNSGLPPLFEPGLADLVNAGLASKRLTFTSDACEAVKNADVYWVAYDTPVDEDDVADVNYVIQRVKQVLPLLPDGCLVLVSSQLPVGSTRSLERYFDGLGSGHRVGFGCSPENLRVGRAIDSFNRPDRVVVGLDSDDDRAKVMSLLRPFTEHVVFMSVESAEMTKHAINSFLAMSVAFANEVAAVCELVGADAREVARGLKTDSRIGLDAYVAPGVAFSGGTLARDIVFLTAIGRRLNLRLPLITSVCCSNNRHRAWPRNRLSVLLGGLEGRRIALLGLTYKPGTDTLRRSYALELARMLIAAGAEIRAFDPVISQWPSGFDLPITLSRSVADAVRGTDAAVITTEWPEFRNEDWLTLTTTMTNRILIDPKGLLEARRSDFVGITYAVVGRTSGTETTQGPLE